MSIIIMLTKELDSNLWPDEEIGDLPDEEIIEMVKEDLVDFIDGAMWAVQRKP